jgi:DNA-directed RNA polymerase specialized sigma24 family protein
MAMTKTALANGVIVEEVLGDCLNVVKKISKRYGIVYRIGDTEIESYLNSKLMSILESYIPGGSPLMSRVYYRLEKHALDYIRKYKKQITRETSLSVIADTKEHADPIEFDVVDTTINISLDYEKNDSKHRVIAHLFTIADDLQRAILTAFLQCDDMNANQIAETLGVYPKKIYRSLERLGRMCDENIRKEALEIIA